MCLETKRNRNHKMHITNFIQSPFKSNDSNLVQCCCFLISHILPFNLAAFAYCLKSYFDCCFNFADEIKQNHENETGITSYNVLQDEHVGYWEQISQLTRIWLMLVCNLVCLHARKTRSGRLEPDWMIDMTLKFSPELHRIRKIL